MTKEETLQEIGENTYLALKEMVDAMGVDYDRLSELKDADELSEYEQLELEELSEAAGDCTSLEDAEQRISEDPLCIELTGKWSLGEEPQADGFIITLGTGGPATRIIGDLDHYGEPCNCELQSQNWFTPWETYRGADSDVIETYCRQFYFGE